MQPIEALQEKIGQSELGREWIGNSLMNHNVWALAESASEEAKATITAMDKWLSELWRLANG